MKIIDPPMHLGPNDEVDERECVSRELFYKVLASGIDAQGDVFTSLLIGGEGVGDDLIFYVNFGEQGCQISWSIFKQILVRLEMNDHRREDYHEWADALTQMAKKLRDISP